MKNTEDLPVCLLTDACNYKNVCTGRGGLEGCSIIRENVVSSLMLILRLCKLGKI